VFQNINFILRSIYTKLEYMKSIVIFGLLLSLLQSCTTYYFTSPQPAGGEKLAEIPENLRGTWNCMYDSVGERKCLEDGGYFIGSDQIEIKEKNQTTTWKIGQEVEMLKLNDFYVLNFVQTQKMFNSKGKQLVSPLYSAMVITEIGGNISLWNVNKPWDKRSAKKISKAEFLSDAVENDTMQSETNFLLNFSLKEPDLAKIASDKPMMFLSDDGTIISGDQIEEDAYDCEPNFENKSVEKVYFRLEDRKFRIQSKENKVQRKIDVLLYKEQFKTIFNDAQKGYALVVTEEFYSDSSQLKHRFNFSENPKKYEVYRLIEYDRDVAPLEQEFLSINPEQFVPFETAQEFIRLNKISFVSFRLNGKPNEKGMTTWNRLSDEDKKMLQEIVAQELKGLQ